MNGLSKFYPKHERHFSLLNQQKLDSNTSKYFRKFKFIHKIFFINSYNHDSIIPMQWNELLNERSEVKSERSEVDL